MEDLEDSLIEKILLVPLEKWTVVVDNNTNKLTMTVNNIRYNIGMSGWVPYEFKIQFLETSKILEIKVDYRIKDYVTLIKIKFELEIKAKRESMLSAVLMNLSEAV